MERAITAASPAGSSGSRDRVTQAVRLLSLARACARARAEAKAKSHPHIDEIYRVRFNIHPVRITIHPIPITNMREGTVRYKLQYKDQRHAHAYTYTYRARTA